MSGLPVLRILGNLGEGLCWMGEGDSEVRVAAALFLNVFRIFSLIFWHSKSYTRLTHFEP
jgi:hypothetical protein